MPLEQLNGTLGKKRAAHFLRRVAGIWNQEKIDQFASMTPRQALDLLLHQEIPEVPLPTDPLTGESWILPNARVESDNFELERYFLGWYMGLFMGLNRQGLEKYRLSSRERLVFFLHTFFTAKTEQINSNKGLYFQNELLRRFALDADLEDDVNFKSLTVKMCIDNAMLRMLDGRLNMKGSPNENFARELFELYSTGRGLEGHVPSTGTTGDYFYFTEQDVQEAAKVLSGFDYDGTFSTLDEDTELPRGVLRGGEIAEQHDNGVKTFSDRFGGRTIEPNPDLMTINGQPTYESVVDEIKQLIDMIYDHEQAAHHVCRRLYRFYVHYEITTELEESIVAEMAKSFREYGYKLQPVLEELVSSVHFYEAGSGIEDDRFGGIIKSPLDLLNGSLHMFKLELPDYEADLDAFHTWTGTFLNWLRRTGLDFFNPIDVAGYDAYHQFPIYNRAWISTNWLTRRYEMIRLLIEGRMMDENRMGKVNLTEIVRESFPEDVCSNARSLIKALAEMMFPLADHLTFESDQDQQASLTAERMNYFRVAFLESPKIDDDPEGTWTIRWTRGVDPETVEGQLENLFNALMQSPEFQLF